MGINLNFLVSTLILSILSFNTLAQSNPEQKYRQLQAAWIYNVARFIEYPNEQQNLPLNLCLMGAEAEIISKYLQKGVSGKFVQQREIKVSHITTDDDARLCHLIYLTAGATLSITEQLNHQRVYLISGPDFPHDAISLFSLRLNGNKLELFLNKKVLQQTSARINPSLLKLALPLEMTP